jgi:hypothetical protein
MAHLQTLLAYHIKLIAMSATSAYNVRILQFEYTRKTVDITAGTISPNQLATRIKIIYLCLVGGERR